MFRIVLSAIHDIGVSVYEWNYTKRNKRLFAYGGIWNQMFEYTVETVHLHTYLLFLKKEGFLNIEKFQKESRQKPFIFNRVFLYTGTGQELSEIRTVTLWNKQEIWNGGYPPSYLDRSRWLWTPFATEDEPKLVTSVWNLMQNGDHPVTFL